MSARARTGHSPLPAYEKKKAENAGIEANMKSAKCPKEGRFFTPLSTGRRSKYGISSNWNAYRTVRCMTKGLRGSAA